MSTQKKETNPMNDIIQKCAACGSIRAVKGHGLGLSLTTDEREARIAFRNAL